jgi:hypothetical protein
LQLQLQQRQQLQQLAMQRQLQQRMVMQQTLQKNAAAMAMKVVSPTPLFSQPNIKLSYSLLLSLLAWD